MPNTGSGGVNQGLRSERYLQWQQQGTGGSAWAALLRSSHCQAVTV